MSNIASTALEVGILRMRDNGSTIKLIKATPGVLPPRIEECSGTRNGDCCMRRKTGKISSQNVVPFPPFGNR